jgi:formylglycine-generating enzyme required for sulfatase activity
MLIAAAVFSFSAEAAATNVVLDLGGSVSLELVPIPAGSFTMGDASLDPGDPNNYGSLPHTVALSNAFHIGKFEVTQAQWQRIMGSEPVVPFTQKGDMLPAENCKWYEARNFCTNLDVLFPAYHFRLPTEAEWQYACRAGTATRYAFGDVYDGVSTGLAAYAWFGENAGIFQTNGAVSVSRPVGTRLPNAWGLYDMHGNIGEFTHSLWARYPYDPNDGREATDGIVGTATDADSLVLAGGGDWHHSALASTVFSRSIVTPAFQRYYFGFRVVMVPRDLAITSQPAATLAVSAGSPATFSVGAASASPIWYQWRKNGVNIVGATNAAYSIAAASAGDAATYRVVAANLSGVAVSAPAQLTVNAVPVISAQPLSQGVVTNAAAVFSVTASGSGLRYQWYKNGGTLLAGATNAAYTTPATVPADDGTVFHVVVSNSTSGLASSQAVLTVTAAMMAPAITADPAGQAVTANWNQPVVFRVEASGTALAYQWQKDGSPLGGKTSPDLTLANPQLSDAGAYRCLASNAMGVATSAEAVLTVTAAAAPVITDQPVTQSVLPGQDATFSVGATGSAPLSYQWQSYISGGWPSISGATGSSYTIHNTWSGDSGMKFRVVVSNPAGSTNSTVTGAAPNFEPALKNMLPSISIHPASRIVLAAAAQTVDFNAQLNHINTPPLVFELHKNGTNTGLSASVTYNSSIKWYSATFTAPAASAADDGDYTILVSNTVGCVSSQVATLTVAAAAVPPVITTQTTGKSVVVKTPSSTSLNLSVAALGTPTLTYQWRKNGTNISQATSSTYTMTGVNASNEAVYSVVVGNPAGSVTSAPIPVVIWTIPSITTQPTPQTAPLGQSAVFSAAAAGTAPLSYQWLKNGVILGGATGEAFTIPAVSLSDSGAVFSVRAGNLAGMAESSGAILNLAATNEAPSIVAQPSNRTVTAGQTAQFSVTAAGTPPLFYQWRTNGIAIAGASGDAYTTPPAGTNDSGLLVSVLVTNAAGSVLSSNALLTVVSGEPEGPGFAFRDSFESYALGASVAGSNGWSVEGGGAVVTAVVYKARLPPGYPMPDAVHSRVLQVIRSAQNALAGPSNQNVNVDFMLSPTNGPLSATLGRTVQLGLAMDTQGVVQVWHSWHDGGVWTQRWTALAKPPSGTGQWVRVSLALDYTNNPAGHTLFRPRMNGIAYSTASGVAGPTNLTSPGDWYVCADSPGAGGGGLKKISGFKLESGQPSRLDDFVVSVGGLAYTEPRPGMILMVR